MADIILSAQPREITGRKVRQLRNLGLIPVVVYGKTQVAKNLQVQERLLDRALHSGGASQLVKVDVEGGDRYNVLIRSVHRHPVSHRLLHADFYAVNMMEKQRVNISVTPVGKPASLVTGLMIFQNMDSVEVEALPADIPSGIEVDITELALDRSITIADLPTISGVTYVSEPQEHVFTMIQTREEEIPEVESVEDVEVVAKGKKDEDEE
jgi:large subunit ribosomal protein L25